MYVQWFVKGIAGREETDPGSNLTWSEAKNLVLRGHGIHSNWLRTKPNRSFTPQEIHVHLTETNLDSHVHDYQNYGARSPFISVAAGCVERDTAASQNYIYSAVTTALDFATDAWLHPGVLFYGWVPVALNPAVALSAVGEAIRDLNVYHRWSPFQLEGEITAKVFIPSNQIQRIEWWNGSVDTQGPGAMMDNPDFIEPKAVTNVRDYF